MHEKDIYQKEVVGKRGESKVIIKRVASKNIQKCCRESVTMQKSRKKHAKVSETKKIMQLVLHAASRTRKKAFINYAEPLKKPNNKYQNEEIKKICVSNKRKKCT